MATDDNEFFYLDLFKTKADAENLNYAAWSEGYIKDDAGSTALLLTNMKSIKVQRILHQPLSKKEVMLFLQLPEPIQVEVLKVLQLFI